MSMPKQTMQFLFGDKELIITVGDLLSAKTEVIVSPAKHSLQHDTGLALHIAKNAGPELHQQSQQLIREYGELETGMAVYTSAGNLPYQSIIHAIGPAEHENDSAKIQLTISRCLKLCEVNEWNSIAFPPISTGDAGRSIEASAEGFFRAITSFWDARVEAFPARVIIYMAKHHFDVFFHAFRNEAINTDSSEEAMVDNSQVTIAEPEAGSLELEDLLASGDNDEINDWFK